MTINNVFKNVSHLKFKIILGNEGARKVLGEGRRWCEAYLNWYYGS